MPFALNATADVVPLRRDDGTRLAVDRSARGIQRIEINLAGRTDATHCLVAAPSFPANLPSHSPTRLRMGARYTAGAAGERVPFIVYVVGYADGMQVGEERLRFFAGSDPALIILEAPFDPAWERYQLVFYADRRMRGTLSIWDPHLTVGATEYWLGEREHIASPIDRTRDWYQEGSRVICQSPYGKHWAEMPPGWRLDRVHPAARAAADWILYSSIDRLAFGVAAPLPVLDPEQARPAGRRTLLSFSLGTDSTAAMTLLPEESLRFYCQRAFSSYFTTAGAKIQLPDPGPWEERLERVPYLTVVPNTFELARIAGGGRHGFGHALGYAGIGLLLADHLDAGALAFGSVMEQVYLLSGHLFTDVVALPSSAYNGLKRVLGAAGLFLTLPTGGLSEVLTSRISEAGRYAGLAISCPRAAPDGTPCGACFKCFRKLRLDGRTNLQEPDSSVLKLLEKYPLKSATSVVYAAQRSGYRNPALERYLGIELGFLDRYFDYALRQMMPPNLAEHARAELARLGIHPMSAEDERRLRELGQVFWPERFDAARAGLVDSPNFS